MNASAEARHAPPLLAALALWGWQTELLPWALGMGLMIESARFSRVRWQLDQGDFNRLWNFTTLLFLGVGLYLFLARQGLGTMGAVVTAETASDRLDGMRQLSQTAIAFLRGLPFVLFPFLLIHAWSGAPTLPWSTFSIYLRNRQGRDPGRGGVMAGSVRVHPGYLYFGVVLFASCASTSHPVLYPMLLAGVVGWGLLPWRNPRFGVGVWGSVWVAVLGLMLVTQRGVVSLREALQALENRILQRVAEERVDQMRNYTALGAVGRLKLSGRIVLRVRNSEDRPPGLLREAAFNRFRGASWGTVHREFQAVPAALEGLVWRLSPERVLGGNLEISRYSSEGETPLALPGRTITVRDLAALSLETNYLAAARARGAPPLAIYAVDYGGIIGGFDGAPEAADVDLGHLAIPEQEAIRRVAEELGLPGKAAGEAVEAVQQYFAHGFEYSLWQRRSRAGSDPSPLVSFLQEWRSGHCEYFATATVLLLRAAGVPTRYAVGYSIDEQRGELWLARGRDAHAWCLAYVEGQWVDVDTTPGNWREHEVALAGWWEGVSDWFSQAWYRFTLWRQRGGNWRIYVFVLSMGALSWLAWRQLRGSRWRRTHVAVAVNRRTQSWPGMDSEFYGIIQRLEKTYGPRPAHEPLRDWLRRLGLESGPEEADRLTEALWLHYRLRFDPRGLIAPERNRLRELAGAVNEELGRAS
jgi:hypothetical protein